MTRRTLYARGFTLIELMVTLAIAAILLMVAVPSFLQFQRNSELTTLTNSLIGAINAARAEAMKTGMNVLVVTANNDTDWSKGWVVFVDVDRDRTYSTGDTVVMSRAALPSPITVSGNGTTGASPSYVMYDGSGFSKDKNGGFGASTLQISRNDSTNTDYSQIRRIKISSTGRIRVCTPKSASDATCTPTGTDT